MHNRPDEAPAIKADLRTAFQHLEARIDRTGTKLLTAIHNWASPTKMRPGNQSAVLPVIFQQDEAAEAEAADALRSMGERLAALKLKAEGRQPPNPNQ
jgi:hypothetical protein